MTSGISVCSIDFVLISKFLASNGGTTELDESAAVVWNEDANDDIEDAAIVEQHGACLKSPYLNQEFTDKKFRNIRTKNVF